MLEGRLCRRPGELYAFPNRLKRISWILRSSTDLYSGISSIAMRSAPPRCAAPSVTAARPGCRRPGTSASFLYNSTFPASTFAVSRLSFTSERRCCALESTTFNVSRCDSSRRLSSSSSTGCAKAITWCSGVSSCGSCSRGRFSFWFRFFYTVSFVCSNSALCSCKSMRPSTVRRAAEEHHGHELKHGVHCESIRILD